MKGEDLNGKLKDKECKTLNNFWDKMNEAMKMLKPIKNRLEIDRINTKLKNIFNEQEFEYRIVFKGNTTKYKDVKIQNNLEFLEEISKTEVKNEPILSWWK